MISHKKQFGIYHWDTFDNETLLITEANTFEIALAKVQKRYKDRISENGADRVEIVDKEGNILRRFSVK